MSKKSSAKRKKFFRDFKYLILNPFTWGYAIIFVILVIATSVVYKSETLTESGIETKFDSVWFTLVSVLAGYFDYCVQSVPGRIAALFLLVLGMLLLSAVTGKIASLFMDIQMKQDKGLVRLKKMKGHFLLCGWRNGFEKILDSILESNPDLTPDLIVLVNDASSEEMEKIRTESRYKGINYVSGDFSEEATLKRCQVETAERVLIISDQSKKYSKLETDSRTVLGVLTMSNMNPKLYIAAELTDSKFVKHLEMAHCDEIILTTEYECSLLASASSGTGFSNVLRELVGNNTDYGIIIDDIPSAYIGKPYKEFKEHARKDAVLIGVLKNTGNFYQRRKDALREAQKNPNIETIVSNLKKVKLLKSNQPVLTPSDGYIIPPNTMAIFVKGDPEDEE
ncbi:MAG: NAD-binding protein [Treponema sp.]|nr:NAD-binding protein [Treponema sp.]